MRVIEAQQPGGPHVLQIAERPEPAPGPGQVAVEVAAAGVNFYDTYVRSGVYQAQFPLVPGNEGAGEVVAVGDGVSDVAVGDRVAWAGSSGNSYADYLAIDADKVVPVPDGLDLYTAAALPLQGMTAHMLIDGVHDLRESEDVLLTAGAGGVGLLLTQLAKSRGARVFTTVSTEEKEELSRDAGADEVIRYDRFTDMTTELSRTVRDLTDGVGVHVAYDGVGKDTFDGSLASVRTRGLMVLFGGASGQVPPFDLQRLNAAGSLFVTRPTVFHYIAQRAELLYRAKAVFDAAAKGALQVRIGAQFPLSEAGEAHSALEGRRTTGKVLLVP
ncbi:MAG TPA: quinone oxidoreductase [Beutenbergiaceae bacterium]|nr:quinone oxidoreductase [Beutenbergiaceae bacterium]